MADVFQVRKVFDPATMGMREEFVKTGSVPDEVEAPAQTEESARPEDVKIETPAAEAPKPKAKPAAKARKPRTRRNKKTSEPKAKPAAKARKPRTRRNKKTSEA